MKQTVRIRLQPLGAELQVAPGEPLESSLFQYGVEFPCGGASDCGGCKVRILEGNAPATGSDHAVLTADEIAAGWRLACHLRPAEPLTLLVEQWETPILADFIEGSGGTREGIGVAIDLGTTTIVVQSVDLATGSVLGVRTALNPQSAYGADIMSRIELSLRDRRLTGLIRDTLAALVADVLAGAPAADVAIVGNTAMHHICCGLDVAPLSCVPFRSPALGEQCVELGLYTARFLRCLGGFVGSDILAGIVATRLHERSELTALIDLGTNGEIVAGNRDRLVCASTAAGPAFEAGRISTGMRAATGAISHVTVEDGALRCRVIGDTAPRGVCGSGLVDAAAAGLAIGAIQPNGRLPNRLLPLCDGVVLKQSDIRELQLAKGAIAAGLTMLLDTLGTSWRDLSAVYLAGAFGNYVDIHSAARIGLIPVDPARVHPSGNTALRGARTILLNPAVASAVQAEHIELAADVTFQERFAEALAFPSTRSTTS